MKVYIDITDNNGSVGQCFMKQLNVYIRALEKLTVCNEQQ